MTFTYTVVLCPDEKGGFCVEVPFLKGIATCGDNLSEALYMAEDAILCYLDGIIEEGEQIPAEHGDIMMRLDEWHVGRWLLVTKVSVDVRPPRRQKEDA